MANLEAQKHLVQLGWQEENVAGESGSDSIEVSVVVEIVGSFVGEEREWVVT